MHDDAGVRSTQLGVSIALGAREPIERMVALIQRAEQIGVDAVWVLDSQTLYKDAFAAISVLAYETEKVKLGPGVTNLLTRHETVTANAIATLTTFAPDRILVGLGTGDSSVRPLGISPLKLSAFSDGVERLRALLRNDTAEYNGRDVTITTTPTSTPPIFVAATQPRMLRVAGAVADGVILLGPANPDTVRLQLAHLEAGARDAGREPGEIQRDLWVGLAVGDGQEPVNDLRSYASTQARVLADWQDPPPSLAPYVEDLQKAASGYDYKDHLRMGASHAALVSDEFVRAVAVVGGFDECRDRLNDLFSVGLDRVSVTLLSRGREQRLESFATLWESLRPPRP